MNKKIFKGLLFILMFIPFIVFADTSVEVSGKVLMKKGDKVIYTVNINTNDNVKNFDAVLDYDNEIFELVSIESANEDNFIKKDSENLSFESNINYSDITERESFSVAKITFKVLKDGVSTSIKLKNISVTSEDGDDILLDKDEFSKSLTIKSNDNTLSSLAINDISLSDFDKDKLEYSIDLDASYDKVTISVTKSSDAAEFVNGYGSRVENISYGDNEILVKVKAEDGAIRTYIINVNRLDDRNSNCELKEIIINTGTISIDFDPKIYKYTIDTYQLTSVEVSASAYDAKASVDIKYPDEFIIGDNEVVITVTSESGDTKDYVIVFVNNDKEVSTYLSSLVVEGYDIDFNKNTNDYTIKYKSKYKDKLIISTKVEEDGVNVEVVGNSDIKPGSVINIVVTPLVSSDDNLQRVYTIHVVEDTSINFYMVLECSICVILLVCDIILFVRRKKIIKKLKQVN